MALSVLSDAHVKYLLASLQPHDVDSLATALTDAFKAYSLGGEGKHQCHRQSISRPEPGAATMLFMPASLPGTASIKVVGVPPAPRPIAGAIMVFDAQTGNPTGLVNAAEVTAFRTALGSILVWRRRERTAHVLVFGAGKQALWHLRLTLVLRGKDVASVTVVNRSRERADGLIARLREMNREGYAAEMDHVVFSVLDQGASAEVLREKVVGADAIFCTTPSREPVFPAEWLLASDEGRAKTRFVSAIGSYKLDMQEIDPVFLEAIKDGTAGSGYNPVADRVGGVVVVDTREGCALEAGELVKAGMEGEKVVEVGELSQTLENGEKAERERLADWFERGLVVYKSVGMGIMDLAITQELLGRATSNGIGATVEEFTERSTCLDVVL